MRSITAFSPRPQPRLWPGLIVLGVLCLGVAAGALAQDDGLEELITQVGEEYARGYSAPFVHAHGPNQNSNLYSTAKIGWGSLKFGFGIKVMGTDLHEDDATFRVVIEDVDLSDFSDDPLLEGETGDVIIEGPTIFGDTDTDGTITLVANGFEVIEDGIPGLLETGIVPLPTPEFSVGGLYGFQVTVRWLPEINLSEYGKSKYFGWGLMWSASGILPTLPVDLVVGFFDQELSVGTLVETTANTVFLGASKDFGMLTAYGGVASESSNMALDYEYEDTGDVISFEVEGRQSSRLTLGGALNLGAMRLNLEIGHGEMTTYSAGLMFGL